MIQEWEVAVYAREVCPRLASGPQICFHFESNYTAQYLHSHPLKIVAAASPRPAEIPVAQ